jgi:integrase
MPRPRRKRSYGTGSIRYLPGGRAEIRWRDATGKQRSKTVDAQLAERALAVRQGDLARVEAGVERDPKAIPTLSVLAEEWFSGREGPANRNNDDERRKWKNHLEPELGRLRPSQVTTPLLRSLIKEKLTGGRIRSHVRWAKKGRDGLAPAYVLQLMRILSSLYTRLIEDGNASANPVRDLPKDTKRAIRPDSDPRNVPFLEKLSDARLVYAGLPEPINIAFAIGVSRGPRPDEIRALSWPSVDLEHRLLHIRVQVDKGELGPPKSGRGRTVTITDELYAVLAPWRLRNPGNGLVVPPRRRRLGWRFISEKAFNKALAPVLARLGLPALTWYQATRHTFASHFVLNGGSLEALAAIFDHSTAVVTQRYAHLRSDRIRPEDSRRAQVDFSPGKVVALSAPVHIDAASSED